MEPQYTAALGDALLGEYQPKAVFRPPKAVISTNNSSNLPCLDPAVQSY